MEEFPICLIAKITADNRNGDIFTKGKEYKAKEMGTTLLVWDNLGCIRHFHGEWQKDKLFKSMFKIKEKTDGEEDTKTLG